EALGRLEEEELLERDGDPDVWRFSHGMVRDVAYESLPKRERRRLHLLVADGLSGNPQMAARLARPQPTRPNARRTCGRRPGSRRGHRPRGAEHEGGRGGLPPRAGARR